MQSLLSPLLDPPLVRQLHCSGRIQYMRFILERIAIQLSVIRPIMALIMLYPLDGRMLQAPLMFLSYISGWEVLGYYNLLQGLPVWAEAYSAPGMITFLPKFDFHC